MKYTDRLTSQRAMGSGCWSGRKKDELVQRLGEYENLGYSPEELKQLLEWTPVTKALPKDDSIKAVTCVTTKGVRSWNRAYWDGISWHGSGSMSNVIAWKDIEPFNGGGLL